MTVAGAPAEATLVALDPETGVPADRVVGWLEEGVPVGVVGVPAGRLFSLLKTGGATDRVDGYLSPGRPLHVAVVDPAAGEWRTMTGASDEVDRGVLLRALDRALAFLVDG